MQTGKRTIDPGTEYDSLFPNPQLDEVVVIYDLDDVKETVDAMVAITLQYAWQTERFAQALKAKAIAHHDEDPYECCRLLWQETYRLIQYAPDDEEHEELRTPARTWADRRRGGDCDCMSIFIGTVLYHWGIPFVYRIGGYPKTKDTLFGEKKFCDDFQHVYPVAFIDGEEVVLDCVVDEFDFEVIPCRAWDGPVIRNPRAGLGRLPVRTPLGKVDPKDLKALAENSERFKSIKEKVEAYKGKFEDEKSQLFDSAFSEKQKEAGLNAEQMAADAGKTLMNAFAEVNVGNMLRDSDFAGLIRVGAKAGNQVVKSVIDSIVPGGGALVEGINGLAKILGFDNINEFFTAPFIMVADAFSEVPEMKLWLISASQACATDMMVMLTENPEIDFLEYVEGKHWRVYLLDGKRHKDRGCKKDCWLWEVKDEVMRPLFETMRQIVKENGFMGLDVNKDIQGAGKNRRFTWWCMDWRKRYHIANEEDLMALGIEPPKDHPDWQPISGNGLFTGNLEDIYTLHVYIYSAVGYKSGYGNANEYLGEVWKGIEPLSYADMVINYRVRLRDNTREIFTGAKIWVKEGNNYREPNENDVITPLEIFHTDKYYIENPKGGPVGALGGGQHLRLKDHLKNEIGIEDRIDYLTAMVALGDQEQEGQEQEGAGNAYWWAWLIGVPVGTILLIFLIKSLISNRK